MKKDFDIIKMLYTFKYNDIYFPILQNFLKPLQSF